MASGHPKGHYSMLASRFDDFLDSDSTLRTLSPESSRHPPRKSSPRSVPHTVYDQLKLLDPALPVLPSFIRDDQALNLLEVAISVIGKRMKRTEEELKLLKCDYEKLRVKNAEAKAPRALSHAPKAEDRTPAATSRVRLRKRDASETSFEDSFCTTSRVKSLEQDLSDSTLKNQRLQQELQRSKVQLELSELKLQELAEVKSNYAALMHDYSREEENCRVLGEANRELKMMVASLREDVTSLRSKLKSMEEQASNGMMTERAVSMLTGALEREKVMLSKERSALLRAKREWIRTRPDPEGRLTMAWEDLHSHWMRLDESTTEVLLLQDTVQTQESKLKEEKSCLESTVQFLENIHEDVERDKLELKEQWSRATQDQQTIEVRGEELTAKEEQLRQLERVLEERMNSLQKLERALHRREQQLTLDCRSDDDSEWHHSNEFNWQKILESPVPISDLTPRDVITPVSTEESPRFLDEV